MPDADCARKLRSVIESFNEAANWLAGVAFDLQLSNRIELQRIAYKDVREKFGLSSQMTCLCIRRVCEAYKRDKSIRPTFRKHAAMPFDQRTMGFRGIDRVSLLSLDGRLIVPFIMGSYQEEQMAYPKGQADLVLRKDGKWFLLVTVDVPESTPIPATDFIGVDMGIANVAADSDGEEYSGEPVEKIRRKHNLQRKRLQRKGTRRKRKPSGSPRRNPGSALTRTTASPRRSSLKPRAPDVGSPSKTSTVSANGLPLKALTLATSSPVGRLGNSMPSSRTRHNWRA